MRTSAVFVSLGFLIACGSSSKAPTPDGGGGGVTPTANGVFPSQGFAGRTVRVEVSGDATEWSSSTTLSFGDSVTVGTITVASPTDLIADITIDPSATLGMRNVTVTDGGSTYTLSNAFEIDAPATLTFQGVVAQGGISVFTVDNADVEHPFDTTSTTDEFGDVTYTNIAMTGPSGANWLIETVTDFQISGVLVTDVDAASGDGTVTIASGPAGGTVVSSTADVMVNARTATALTANTAAQGSVTNPYDSQLYSYTPGTAPDVQDLALATTSTTAAPAVLVLPASGHYSDFITFGAVSDTINATAGGEQYFIYWDNTATAGYNYTITENDTALTHTTALTTAEDTTAAAAAITLPTLGNNGSFGGASGQQWMKFTLAAADVGKKIHVIATSTDASDVQVDVYPSLADATAGTGQVIDACDDGGDADCVSAATTAAGTYYIEVQPGFFGGDAFTAAIYLTAN